MELTMNRDEVFFALFAFLRGQLNTV